MKKTLKGLFAFIFVIVFGFALVACKDRDGKKKDPKIKIVVTSTMLKDATEQIAKDKADVYGIMGPGVDPHVYESQPEDNKQIKAAKLLIVSGINFEAKVLEGYKNICKAENVPLLNVGDVLFEKYKRVEEDTESEKLGFLPWFEDGKEDGYDPHFWNDIRLWKKVVTLIYEKLAEIDGKNKDFYKTNHDNYQKELDELITWVKEKTAEVEKEKRIVITGHDAFRYMEREFGYKVLPIQGVSTETEATPEDIKKTAQQAKDNGVKAIFIESTIPEKTAKAVIEQAKALGHDLKLQTKPLFSDALGTKEEGTDTYIKMYKNNIEIIIDSLK